MEQVLTLDYLNNNQVAKLTINRPKVYNALNSDVLQSIILAFNELRQKEVKVVVISGNGGKAFAAGADIATLNSLGNRALADYIELGQRAMRSIEKYPMPVIAAIEGYALGGGLELALACDIILANSDAKLGQPEVNLGIIPGFGATKRLAMRCGIGRAKYLILTGDTICGTDAFHMGIVDKVVEGDVVDQALTLANKVASKAPLALSSAKRVINEGIAQDLLSGLQREVEEFIDLFSTEDRKEGMDAFLQKREPHFKGC